MAADLTPRQKSIFAAIFAGLNLFTSNKVSSSTRCAWYVWHSQDFPPRALHMCERRFHDAKSWPLCCKSPAPAPSAIAFLHRKCLKRTYKALNFSNSRNLNSRTHIFEFLYIIQLSYKQKLHHSRASAIKVNWRGHGDKSTCQPVKLNSLSSGTCHRKWDLSPTKKICRRQLEKINCESLARRRKCLRDFSVLFLRVLVCLKTVFSDAQYVKYDRDITPRPHLFHGTNSHKATQVVHRKWE